MPVPDSPKLNQGSYSTNEWNAQAAEYEIQLGAALAKLPRVRKAAQKTLARLHDVLALDYLRRQRGRPAVKTLDEARKNTADVFFLNEPSSAGQIGTGNGSAYMKYLLGDQARVREIMTAIFNATYFRSVTLAKSQSHPDYEDVSLKETIQNIYFTEGNVGNAARLRLNTDHLTPYTDFLQRDTQLLTKRAEAEKTSIPAFKESLAQDVFSLGCIALYRGTEQYDEVRASYESREWQSDHSRSTTPQDYARLGLPLSKKEREFLGADPESLQLSSFDTTDMIPVSEVPVDPSTGEYDLMPWLQKKGVITYCPHYEIKGTDTQLTGFTLVKTQQVEGVGIRQADLEKGYAGPEFPLQWKEGWAYWGINPGSPWYATVRNTYGYRVVAAISGTTARMLLAFGWLNVKDCPASDYIEALMAWMLPCRDHSLYEIIKAADIAMLDPPNETQTVPTKGTKHCLIKNARDKQFVQTLTSQLKTGSEDAYPQIQKTLLDNTRLLTSPAMPPPPGTEAIYREKIANNSLQEVHEELHRMVELVRLCIQEVTDYRTQYPPDPPPSPYPDPDGQYKEFLHTRIDSVWKWLGRLEVNGPEFLETFPIERSIAIFVYTGEAFKVMNRAAESSELDGFIDAIWKEFERYITDGKGLGAIMPYVQGQNSLYGGLMSAREKYRCGSADKEEYLKLFEEEFKGRFDIWDPLFQESKLHNDMAGIALDSVGAYTCVAYRGTWCLWGNTGWPVEGQSRIMNPNLTIGALTSSSLLKEEAHDFAERKIEPGKRWGVLATITLTTGKPIDGISQLPEECEILIPRGVRLKGPDRKAPPRGDNIVKFPLQEVSISDPRDGE